RGEEQLMHAAHLSSRSAVVVIGLVAHGLCVPQTPAQPPEQPIAVDGTADLSPPPTAKPPPVPFSVQFGVTPPAVPEVRLGAIDTTALIAEDAVTDRGGKCLRYGIG